jgi:hypothetical protein
MLSASQKKRKETSRAKQPAYKKGRSLATAHKFRIALGRRYAAPSGEMMRPIG